MYLQMSVYRRHTTVGAIFPKKLIKLAGICVFLLNPEHQVEVGRS